MQNFYVMCQTRRKQSEKQAIGTTRNKENAVKNHEMTLEYPKIHKTTWPSTKRLPTTFQTQLTFYMVDPINMNSK